MCVCVCVCVCVYEIYSESAMNDNFVAV
jgi:hypothetical protein